MNFGSGESSIAPRPTVVSFQVAERFCGFKKDISQCYLCTCSCDCTAIRGNPALLGIQVVKELLPPVLVLLLFVLLLLFKPGISV